MKIRRVLDKEVGLLAGDSDRDIISLAQVLTLLHTLIGAPTHPTRPTAERRWEEEPDDVGDAA